MTAEVWKSAGLHLLSRNGEGWLSVTPEFLRAYLSRPEVHPIDTSCAEEIALFDALMADPLVTVPEERLNGLADQDAADNYRVVLSFRDLLVAAGTIEGAYLKLMNSQDIAIPPVFIDQMVHAITGNMLRGCSDPFRYRAAELLFREQSVTVDDGGIMLADEEIVEMHASSQTATGIGQLLAEIGTPQKSVELDVLSEKDAAVYWERADQFDTVIDMRFEQPALDAFARVIETWLSHMLRLDVRVEPVPKIEDGNWRWHIGLDREATGLLNALYEGKTPSLEDVERILALFRLWPGDDRLFIEDLRGRPIYLGLAMTKDGRLKVKPQNLITNLPLIRAA